MDLNKLTMKSQAALQEAHQQATVRQHPLDRPTRSALSHPFRTVRFIEFFAHIDRPVHRVSNRK